MKLAHELAVLKTMAAELPDYLLSGVLFWQMQAGSDFPKLSLGGLLLTHARLQAANAQLSAAQREELERISRDLDATLERQPVAAEKKAEQEQRARLNLWQAFLADCKEEPRACAENYQHEVSQRVIASLLLRRFTRLADSPAARRLAPLDARLRARLGAGGFIWAADLQPGFPRTDFWFLYGRVG